MTCESSSMPSTLHPFLDFGQGQNAADLGIEPTDDLARHSGGTVGGVQETTGTYG